MPPRGALERALADSISRELGAVEREAEGVVIGEIAIALGAVGDRSSGDLIFRALAVRPNAECAEALGRLRVARAIPLLVRSLADASARLSAREALLRFGEEPVSALVAALAPKVAPGEHEGANSVLTRGVVAEVLGDLPGAASEHALGLALLDPQAVVRIAAAPALARRGVAGAVAIPALAEALAGERWDVADEASAALLRVGSEAALHAVGGVARAGPTLPARRRAIRTLARWPAPDAARALARLCRDPEPLVRDSLVEALRPRSEAVAREALETLATDADRRIRRHASAALGRGAGGIRGLLTALVGRRGGGGTAALGDVAAAEEGPRALP